MQGVMGDEKPDRSPAVLSGELAAWFDKDMPKFFQTLDLLSASLRSHGQEIRQTLMNRGEIKVAQSASPFPIGAVDCANVVQSWGEVVTALALGIRVDPHRRPEYLPARVTDSNTEAAKHLAIALRIFAETALIGGAETPVIVDNSWWSFLMDTNKVITAYEGLSDADGRLSYEFIFKGICGRDGRNGTFITALYNQKAIAISKSGSSQTVSKRPEFRRFFSTPISDLALFGVILQEDEYTRPRLIKEMTEGHAGVEARGWSKEDRARIFARFQDADGLHVTYYKPWPFKKAYRLEYDPKEYRDEKLYSLLATIKHETRFPTITEPVSQMTADVLSKQVASLAKLYGPIHAPRYPELFFSTRTK